MTPNCLFNWSAASSTANVQAGRWVQRHAAVLSSFKAASSSRIKTSAGAIRASSSSTREAGNTPASNRPEESSAQAIPTNPSPPSPLPLTFDPSPFDPFPFNPFPFAPSPFDPSRKIAAK